MKAKRGQILKDLRKSKGLNQSYFSDMLGISLTAYQKYEHGTAEPNFDNLSKLADFYGVTTDYLLGREPAPNPFADLNLSEDDEAEVIAKYMSLPPEIRACMLDVLVQLGEAAKKRQSDSVQSTAQNQIKKTDTYNSKLAIARSSESNYKPAPTEEQYSSFEECPDDMID